MYLESQIIFIIIIKGEYKRYTSHLVTNFRVKLKSCEP